MGHSLDQKPECGLCYFDLSWIAVAGRVTTRKQIQVYLQYNLLLVGQLLAELEHLRVPKVLGECVSQHVVGSFVTYRDFI